jgi:hypothetical protein
MSTRQWLTNPETTKRTEYDVKRTMQKAMWTGVVAAMLVPAVVAAADKSSQIGAFTVTSAKDPMSDANRNSIMADGVAKPGPHGLAWSCREDGLNVTFVWGRYLMGDDSSIPVAYRFPNQPAVSKGWDIATSHKAAFIPMSEVKTFTAAALTAESVTLRVTDRDGDVVTESFKLDGLAEALRTLPCAARHQST